VTHERDSILASEKILMDGSAIISALLLESGCVKTMLDRALKENTASYGYASTFAALLNEAEGV